MDVVIVTDEDDDDDLADSDGGGNEECVGDTADDTADDTAIELLGKAVDGGSGERVDVNFASGCAGFDCERANGDAAVGLGTTISTVRGAERATGAKTCGLGSGTAATGAISLGAS